MYSIYADNLCIFDDTAPERAHMAVGAKLTLSAGAAGSLTLQLPRGCAGYDSVQRLKTTISVKRDWNEIWMGRVLSEKDDIFGTKTLFCEGAQAWLNDTVQPTATFTGTPTQLLTAILEVHNNKAGADRTIAVGDVTVTGSGLTAEVDYNTTLDAVNKLVSSYGGVLRMRYPSEVPTLDWLANYPTATGTPQALVFNENLLDFTRSWDLADYATVCYVRGGEIEGTDPAQTAFGSYTLQSAVTLYGVIEKFLNLSDCTTNQLCVDAATDYLTKQQFDSMTLEVTAVDLHMLDPAIRPFDLLERVSVSSPLHGLTAAAFAVTGMDIPLDDPGNTRYTLGYVNVAYVRRANTLTQRTVQAETEQREYTDATAAVLEAADDAINARVDSAEGDIATLEITQGQIEARVESAEGDISTVTQTANEIKLKVSDENGNYNVLTVESGGVTIANGSSATNINGGFLDAATVQAGIIRGALISVIDGSGNVAGNFYTDGSIGQIGISALMVDFARDGDQVYFASPASIHFADSGLTLAQLLGI